MFAFLPFSVKIILRGDFMVAEELRELIQQIQERGCEEQSIEVKAAHIDCPKKLYDTISAFEIGRAHV